MVSDISIDRADSLKDPLIKNLLSYYVYDMSEWFKFDPDEAGCYSYDLDSIDLSSQIVFIAKHQSSPLGIAIVERLDDFDMKEFFVLRRYRGSGIAQAFCRYIWESLRGEWTVRVFADNKPAVPFWTKAISEYTNGLFSKTSPKIDGKRWVHYHFSS